MAFATSNVQTTVFGSLRITYGQWSGADADAAGTITISGGQIWLAEFTSQDTGSKYMVTSPVKYSVSGTAGILTVTVENLAGTTNGRFLIVSS